ncbi:amidase family protein, partial [Klebsiella pneumoniae]|uniref:amidase family protein n=1 Tax=Klebsiella pneumoniae TaxID=573 RepID=UPI0034D58E8E
RLCRGHPRQGARHGQGFRCEARQGRGGALEGIPLGIKDLFATEGVHTQACSHVLNGFKPHYESTVSANLWADGAVMLGKLNMDEFAMGSSN